MPETSNTQGGTGEVFLITRDDGLYVDAVEKIDLAKLPWDQDVPHIDSIKDASKALDILLGALPRTVGCIYKLDDLDFSQMRSSVLRAGIVVLAVRAGHQAVIAPISARLSAAHWRSEFIFRATRGIRLLRPELPEQELLNIVTREIQFYEEQAVHDGAGIETGWLDASPQEAATAH